MTTINPVRAQTYGLFYRALHWTVFGLIAAQYAVGSLMPHIGNDTRYEGLVLWHGIVGSTILFFVLVRLFWRLTHPVVLETTLPAWQAHLASFTL